MTSKEFLKVKIRVPMTQIEVYEYELRVVLVTICVLLGIGMIIYPIGPFALGMISTATFLLITIFIAETVEYKREIRYIEVKKK